VGYAHRALNRLSRSLVDRTTSSVNHKAGNVVGFGRSAISQARCSETGLRRHTVILAHKNPDFDQPD
jgi:hypothetical protein